MTRRCQVPAIIGSSMGILWLCLLCEDDYGMQCCLKGPLGLAGWCTFHLLLRTVRVSNGQTLYCLLIDVCKAEARVVGVIWAQLWPSYFTSLESGSRETCCCHCADGWLRSGPIWVYSHTFPSSHKCWGRVFAQFIGLKQRAKCK